MDKKASIVNTQLTDESASLSTSSSWSNRFCSIRVVSGLLDFTDKENFRSILEDSHRVAYYLLDQLRRGKKRPYHVLSMISEKKGHKKVKRTQS